MTKIGVISDTHFSRGTQSLPGPVQAGFVEAGVRMILHAGDIVALGALRNMELVAPVLAVRGNIHHEHNEQLAPIKRIVEVEGCIIGMVHVFYPPPEGVFGRKVDCVVFGHTHSPENTVRDGVLHFNPGSPTRRRRERRPYFGILAVEGSKITGKIIRF